jgi:hypothetical protein
VIKIIYKLTELNLMKNQEKKLFNRVNSYTKKILFCFIILFLIALPVFQLNATNPALKSAQQGLIDSAKDAGLTDKTNPDEVNSEAEIRSIITQIVGYILAILGVILLVQIIFAGYSWMMSGGNEEKIKKSKDKIVSSIIGLAIIMIAYVLVSSIFGLLVQITQEVPPSTN